MELEEICSKARRTRVCVQGASYYSGCRHASRAFFEGNREGFTLVPIPPSKARADPLYDDRLLRALRAPGVNLDVRDALFFRETMRACHEYPAQ